eukprot:gene17947-23573_t
MSITIADIEQLLYDKLGIIEGTDSNEEEYTSITELWFKELNNSLPTSNQSKYDKSQSDWYKNAYSYWEDETKCPITDDGVLGGYGKLTPSDVKGSNSFIDELISENPTINFQFDKSVDCGGGIGRVTKHLLLPRFQSVDLLEQSPRLLNASSSYIGNDSIRVNCICKSLQEFQPLQNTYDLIWIQWVVGHLHDIDFINFFKSCSIGLKPNGYIILKDNCAESYTFVVDKEDSSVARCPEYMRILLNLSNLEIIKETIQLDFPSELYPVHMFALRPKV